MKETIGAEVNLPSALVFDELFFHVQDPIKTTNIWQ